MKWWRKEPGWSRRMNMRHEPSLGNNSRRRVRAWRPLGRILPRGRPRALPARGGGVLQLKRGKPRPVWGSRGCQLMSGGGKPPSRR